MAQERYLVRFEPAGVTVTVSAEASLFEAARKAGIAMPSICGGQCDCGECQVWVLEGQLSPVTREEKSYFSAEELAQGRRLACCARVRGAVRVRV